MKKIKLLFAITAIMLCMTSFAACGLFGEDNNGGEENRVTDLFTVSLIDEYNSNMLPIENVSKGAKLDEIRILYGVDGYIFDGWYKEQDFINKWDFASDTVEKDITLYAKWEKTILQFKSFRLNGEDVFEVGLNPNTEPKVVEGEIVIPATYRYKPVVRIIDHGFRHNDHRNNYIDTSKVTRVTIPASIIIIEEYAFYGCTGLEAVLFADDSNLSKIEMFAFANTGIKEMTLPSSLESHEGAILAMCKQLESFTTPLANLAGNALGADDLPKLKTVTMTGGDKISEDAFFRFYTLETVKIPASVKTIDDGAFASCTSLKNIIFEPNRELNAIGSNAFYGCKELKSFDLSGVEKIDYEAFRASGLKSVTIPKSVTFFYYGVFMDCADLETVIFDKDSPIDAFLYKTFMNCVSLKSVNIPKSVSKIEEYVFGSCSSLKNITLPASLEYIQSWAFSNCSSLESILLSENVKRIEHSAFLGCENLTIYAEVDEPVIDWMGDYWHVDWNITNRPVLWGCSLGQDKTYVTGFTKTALTVSGGVYGINAPYREGYEFGGWSTTSLLWFEYGADEIRHIPNNTYLYPIWFKPKP